MLDAVVGTGHNRRLHKRTVPYCFGRVPQSPECLRLFQENSELSCAIHTCEPGRLEGFKVQGDGLYRVNLSLLGLDLIEQAPFESGVNHYEEGNFLNKPLLLYGDQFSNTECWMPILFKEQPIYVIVYFHPCSFGSFDVGEQLNGRACVNKGQHAETPLVVGSTPTSLT